MITKLFNEATEFLDVDTLSVKNKEANSKYSEFEDGTIFLELKNKSIDQKKYVQTYTEFVGVCTEINKNKGNNIYSIVINNNALVVFLLNLNYSINSIVAYYEFELEAFSKFFNNLFEVKDKYKDIIIETNSTNRFKFIVDESVLLLLLTAEKEYSAGKKLVHKYDIVSKNGKIRKVSAPTDAIKPSLKLVNKVLQQKYDKVNEDFQVAYKKGKSIIDNAKIHQEKKYHFRIDIHDFYPSCKRESVEKYTGYLFYSSINCDFLHNKFLDIILDNDGLFLGNPISGTLANIIISNPVKYIRNMCRNKNINFSVYADDMCFSSDRFLKKEYIISMFDRAFIFYNLEDSFILNARKSIGSSKAQREITGVVINHNNELTIHRYRYKEIRQQLYVLSYGGIPSLTMQQLTGKINFAINLDETDKMKNLVTKYLKVIKENNLVCKKHLIKFGLYEEGDTNAK